MSTPVFFPTPTAFRRWLSHNALTTPELFVGFYKVGSGKPSLTWPESVDEALCFGWIDGVRNRIDDEAYQIRFTPRRPGSIWSAINIAKVEALISQGRMQPPGLEAYSHRTDRKSSVYSYERGTVPTLSAGEIALFKENAPAWRFFSGLPRAIDEASCTGS